jgi:hypothetical protein
MTRLHKRLAAAVALIVVAFVGADLNERQYQRCLDNVPVIEFRTLDGPPDYRTHVNTCSRNPF